MKFAWVTTPVKLIRRHDNRLPIYGAGVGQVPFLNLTSRTLEYG